MTSFYIKQGDNEPALVATLTDVHGVAVDLTGATAYLTVSTVAAPVVTIIERKPMTINPDGTVQYSFLQSETAIPGIYNAEIRLQYVGGFVLTAPTAIYLTVVIVPSLG